MISIEKKATAPFSMVTGEVTANEILMQLAHQLSNLMQSDTRFETA